MTPAMTETIIVPRNVAPGVLMNRCIPIPYRTQKITALTIHLMREI